MGRVRYGSVETAVRKDLTQLSDDVRRSGLAQAALLLARRLDADPEREQDAATLVRELRATLEQLQRVTRPQEKDFFDDLAARRSAAGQRNAAERRNAAG